MEWITIKEASGLVGRKPSTLRCTINQRETNANQRTCFLYKKKHVKGRKIWFIEKNSLVKFYKTSVAPNVGGNAKTNTEATHLLTQINEQKDLINFLKNQLSEKDYLLKESQERLKESQYMLGAEQKTRRLLEEKGKKGVISGLLAKYGL
jgi:hypothetical protein